MEIFAMPPGARPESSRPQAQVLSVSADGIARKPPSCSWKLRPKTSQFEDWQLFLQGEAAKVRESTHTFRNGLRPRQQELIRRLRRAPLLDWTQELPTENDDEGYHTVEPAEAGRASPVCNALEMHSKLHRNIVY